MTHGPRPRLSLSSALAWLELVLFLLPWCSHAAMRSSLDLCARRIPCPLHPSAAASLHNRRPKRWLAHWPLPLASPLAAGWPSSSWPHTGRLHAGTYYVQVLLAHTSGTQWPTGPPRAGTERWLVPLWALSAAGIASSHCFTISIGDFTNILPATRLGPSGPGAKCSFLLGPS